MRSKQKFILAVLAFVLIIVTACENASDQSGVEANDPLQDIDSNQTGSITEDSSDHVNENEINDQEETSSQTDENPIDEEEMVNNGSETIPDKTEYLEKLNQMEEADREVEAGSTIAELEEQEDARYHKWDDELNQIYRVLTEQLSDTDMDDLREEQREWIVFRDESAKEASLEYEGGTTESLEYIATQASLTRERCYLLVAQYLE